MNRTHPAIVFAVTLALAWMALGPVTATAARVAQVGSHDLLWAAVLPIVTWAVGGHARATLRLALGAT